MTQPQKLVHMRSAVIGAQLASLAMRGSSLPPDTAEGMIVQQLEHHGLQRFDGDLAQCGAGAAEKANIRRMYAFKMVECLLVRCSDPILLSDDELERVVRRGWKMAQVMEEEDQVGTQLDTVRQPSKGE